MKKAIIVCLMVFMGCSVTTAQVRPTTDKAPDTVETPGSKLTPNDKIATDYEYVVVGHSNTLDILQRNIHVRNQESYSLLVEAKNSLGFLIKVVGLMRKNVEDHEKFATFRDIADGAIETVVMSEKLLVDLVSQQRENAI